VDIRDQEQYRLLHNFRAARLREDGSAIFVDDVTFNPEQHEEIVAAPVEPVVVE